EFHRALVSASSNSDSRSFWSLGSFKIFVLSVILWQYNNNV
ncbi:13905_t:CDS:2, partial [Dentiscutata erythropus]